MTNFKLNLSSLNDNVISYKSIKKMCLEDVNSINNNLKNTDSGWKDNNSLQFMKIVKNDNYKINNYFNNLDSLYKQLEYLKNNFDNLLTKYKYKKGSTITYDEGYYTSSIRSLNNVNSYLNEALKYVNYCNFRSDFSAYYKVSTLRNEIKKMKSMVTSIINTLSGFKNTTNRILTNTRMGISRVRGVDLNIKPINYSWHLVDSQVIKKEVTCFVGYLIFML